MEESRALATFVSNLHYDAIPRAVREKTKSLIFDQVGVMLGASTLPWSRIISDYVRSWGPAQEESTVFNDGFRTKVENAVFANSSFGHGFEYDDIYIYGNSHPGCIVVPAAIAMAERQQLSGRDLIVAVVAGYEAMGRINAAITPSCALRGFHAPTSITGPFGAAAAVGKSLAFDPEIMLNALAIAGSHSSGVTEYDQGGGSVKRMHAGMAAHGGVRSAFLAQRGLTGPATILEGRHGTFAAFADGCRPEEITDGLGETFKVVMGTGFKAYCACAPIHAAIDALLSLRREHEIRVEDISEIVMGTNRRSLTHVQAPPMDLLSAQFSSPFSLALTVIRGGNGFLDYTEHTLRDPAILRLAAKVTVQIDNEVDADYPTTRAARVTVRLKQGRSVQAKVDHCKGAPENPLTEHDLERKFRELAGCAISESRVTKAMRLIRTLEDQADLSGLIDCLSDPTRCG